MMHDRVQMLQVQTELCFCLDTHDHFAFLVWIGIDARI